MSEFHKLTIKSLHNETKDCVTVGFHVPVELMEQFSFKAGQYVTLKTEIEGNEIRRDYSLCASPYSNEFKVAIKRVDQGVFSSFANTEFRVNDVLHVSEPRGRFIYDPNSKSDNTVMAFAAGSGITPIMSIAKTVLTQESQSKMVLVYGNKSIEDTIFYQDILNLKSEYPDRFFVHFVFSQSQETDALFGRIEKSTVNYVVKNQYKNDTVSAFYLCGPESMIQMVSDVLKENNIDEKRIFFELFTSSTPEEGMNEDLPTGNTEVTIMVDDEETTFVMPQTKSVLEAALEKDIDAPYSCQGGICSSCLARITEGTATMRQNNILTDQEVAEGLVLTCQAHPTSSSIYIDYDDV